MASETLAVPALCKIPHLFDGLIGQVDRLLLKHLAGECSYEGSCPRLGTVTHLELEQQFCVEHFWAVCRG